MTIPTDSDSTASHKLLLLLLWNCIQKHAAAEGLAGHTQDTHRRGSVRSLVWNAATSKAAAPLTRPLLLCKPQPSGLHSAEQYPANTIEWYSWKVSYLFYYIFFLKLGGTCFTPCDVERVTLLSSERPANSGVLFFWFIWTISSCGRKITSLKMVKTTTK